MLFEISKPLRFGECDLTGIAYHPAYLSMMVDVREAMFASFGVPWPEVFSRGIGLPLLSLNLTFMRPTTYGDTLDFALSVRTIGRSSMSAETLVSVAGTPVFTVAETSVCTSTDTHKSQPWPDDIRAGLERYLEPADESIVRPD